MRKKCNFHSDIGKTQTTFAAIFCRFVVQHAVHRAVRLQSMSTRSLQQMNNILTRQDVVQLVVRLAVQQIHNKSK